MHLAAALIHFQKKGQYQEFNLVMAPGKEIKGVDQLYERCEIVASTPQQRPTVFIFDRDRPTLLSKVIVPSGSFKSWGNNVYSFAIPIPVHRSGESQICIEMMYTDIDLARMDNNGRRLFLQKEFNENGFHESNMYIHHSIKSTKLIIDNPVFETGSQKSVGLSKNAFAEYIERQTQPFDQISFDSFGEIFQVFSAIWKDYLGNRP
jgi:RNA-directed DNA polymerase